VTLRQSAIDLASIPIPPSVDRRGVRFEHDGRIFRAFNEPHASFYRSLLASPALEGLFDAGLARSWVSDVAVEGFGLVVESERVPVVSYPQEWPTVMLREAALVVARLGLALAPLGLTLVDAHPWNVLFDGARGVFIDLGSITEGLTVKPAWEREFRAYFAVPLALHARGWHTLGDATGSEHRMRGAKAVFEHDQLRRFFPWGFRRVTGGARSTQAYFGRLVDYLETTRAVPVRTKWSRYVQAPHAKVGDAAGYDQKQRAVDGFLSALPPGTVLDVGANAGWFSELAVHHGQRVTALDPDDVTIGILYERAREANLPILPLRMDIMWPTPAHGMGLAYASAPERLRSDASLWLAVVHHLARDGYPFEAIAAAVDAFTATSAAVEFVPSNDVHLKEWAVAKEPWYTQERFIAAMARYFPVVEVVPSSPDPRTLLLFRRA
jgi:hypothetical protein